MNIETTIANQRTFYQSNQTKDIAYRKQALRTLRKAIRNYQKAIEEALYKDLHKSSTEAFMSEIGLVLEELTFQLRHIDDFSKPSRRKTPLVHFPSVSFVVPQPYGVVLIMAPWNYPFQLCLEPTIGAIAAGNTVVIKPSAYAPHTAHVIKEMIEAYFPSEYITVVEGGREENLQLLNQRFDYIFFTGGTQVGKLVLEKASQNLTPVSLELGGKSPCIVDESANIKRGAKRIVFGKLLNAGQTCVAPDYILVHRSIKDELICYMHDEIQKALGDDPIHHPDYPRIINEKHFDRLCAYLHQGTICCGGRMNRERLQIEPTIMEVSDLHAKIMQEEIFGPILPVVTYDSLQEAIHFIHSKEHPLALYLFTTNREHEKKVLKECSFGGGCINDTIIHLASSYMGFGGVGKSGMGAYHGYDSFLTFSHMRSIVKKSNLIDLPFRYYPYKKWKEQLMRKVMR